jgi:RNA polymerase sigma factor (sigma-70 family)
MSRADLSIAMTAPRYRIAILPASPIPCLSYTPLSNRTNTRPIGAASVEPSGVDLAAELERHHAACYGWALSCCRWSRGDAEDVLHDSYLKVLEGRATFAGRSCFRTWMFGVIRRTALEHRRRSLTRWLWPFGAPDQGREAVDPALDPATALGHSETSARLVRAMAMLPRRQREVLHLVFYEELTIEQAAVVIGVALGTARTHYERGKQRLRAILDASDAG